MIIVSYCVVNAVVLLVVGLGGAGGDGGKPTLQQVDSRQVRLPGELQCGVHARGAKDHRFRATPSQVQTNK